MLVYLSKTFLLLICLLYVKSTIFENASFTSRYEVTSLPHFTMSWVATILRDLAYYMDDALSPFTSIDYCLSRHTARVQERDAPVLDCYLNSDCSFYVSRGVIRVALYCVLCVIMWIICKDFDRIAGRIIFVYEWIGHSHGKSLRLVCDKF